MKAVIIEDELRSRIVLGNFINNYCKGVKVLGEADTRLIKVK